MLVKVHRYLLMYVYWVLKMLALVDNDRLFDFQECDLGAWFAYSVGRGGLLPHGGGSDSSELFILNLLFFDQSFV